MYRLLLFALLLPSYVVHAQTLGGQNTSAGTVGGGGNAVGNSIGAGASAAPACNGICLMNPLGDATIIGFFTSIVDVLLVFAIPLVVFYIMYAGFLYVTARGNPGQVQKAHNALLYAIIGGVLILAAHALLVIVQNTVSHFTS